MCNNSSFPALCCSRGMESLSVFVLKGVTALTDFVTVCVDVVNDFNMQDSPVKGGTTSHFLNMNFGYFFFCFSTDFLHIYYFVPVDKSRSRNSPRRRKNELMSDKQYVI
jgi:hypothetical protein